MLKDDKPVYLAPATEPFITAYDELFSRFSNENIHTLSMTVKTDLVYEGNIALLQQLIMALQHKPNLIQKLVFCLDIKFTAIEDSNIFIPDIYWKRDAAYYRWFHKLSASPVMLFFINDEDASFYLLAGDLLADNLVGVQMDEGRQGMACLEGDELVQVVDRLFDSCRMMLMYCHGSGFNPEPYIQSLLADLGLPVTFEQVYERYAADIATGIRFRAISAG